MTGSMNPGHVLAGRFVIECLKAAGGMGKVYRAADRQTGQPVAIKVISVDHPSLPGRLRLEARALLELNHPAIVRHVAHETDPDRGLYLAMEWLDGVTLSERLRNWLEAGQTGIAPRIDDAKLKARLKSLGYAE